MPCGLLAPEPPYESLGTTARYNLGSFPYNERSLVATNFTFFLTFNMRPVIVRNMKTNLNQKDPLFHRICVMERLFHREMARETRKNQVQQTNVQGQK